MNNGRRVERFRYPHGSGYSSVELLDPVVGDYGHIKAQYVNSEEKTKRVHMYYSLVAERIEVTSPALRSDVITKF